MFTVKAKRKNVKAYDGWSGEFATEQEAVDHMAKHFNMPYFNDRLDFAIFVKDSAEKIRFVRAI